MSDTTQILKLKRGTQTALTAKLINDNRLQAGEPAFEIDTGQLKIGDGVSDYAELPYVGNGSGPTPQSQIVFRYHEEFPAIGKTNMLYIATDEHNNYIWTGNKYTLLSVNQHEIDAGNADTIYN